MNPSARVPWLLFAVAWGSNHFVPLLIVYRERLALSSVELAVLFGVYAVGLVPGLLFGGPLSDRVGRRRIVVPSSAIALLGTCALGGAGSAGFPALLAGRFVVGLGAGATFSAGTAWVQDLAADEPIGTGARRAAVALSSGFGGGPLVSGLLAQWLPAPMRLPYAVQGTVLVMTLVAVVLAGSEGSSLVHLAPGAAGRATTPAPPDAPSPPGFAGVVLGAPWVFAFPAVSNAVLPALIRDRLGSFAVAFAGVVTSVTLLTGVAVQPKLRERSPRAANLFGLACGAAGLLCGAAAAAGQSVAGVLVAAVLLGSGYGGCLIAGLRFIESNAAPRSRGRLNGVFYAMTYVGFASPLVLAAIGRHVGEITAVMGAAALALATLAYRVLVRRAI
jgi:MFS family permease